MKYRLKVTSVNSKDFSEFLKEIQKQFVTEHVFSYFVRKSVMVILIKNSKEYCDIISRLLLIQKNNINNTKISIVIHINN
jgi:hypothetical protein